MKNQLTGSKIISKGNVKLLDNLFSRYNNKGSDTRIQKILIIIKPVLCASFFPLSGKNTVDHLALPSEPSQLIIKNLRRAKHLSGYRRKK